MISIYDKLFDWQKNIINKYQEKTSLGLFLDMGTGKTPISLAFAESNNCTKALIITINSKATEKSTEKGSWLNWALQSKIQYNFKTKKDTVFNNNDNELLITNYESLYDRKSDKKEKAPLKEYLINFINSCKNKKVSVIIDESHKLSNTSSIQTTAVNNILKKLKLIANKTYIYLLTGTPFTTGYIDIYSQLKILGCKLNKTDFINNYCIRGRIKGLLEWQQPIIGYKNLDELYKLIHRYALTIKSEEVCSLPEQIFINHTYNKTDYYKMFVNEKVPGNEIIKFAKKINAQINDELYNKNSKINNPFYRNLTYPADKWIPETISAFWMRCRQISIGFQGNSEEYQWFDKTRLNKLKEFLLTNPDNYIIFYNYVPELLELYSICDELNYNIDVYSGEIKSLIFYDKYSKLSENEKLISKNNIIIANFASGSTGKNWQEYNKCILFSLPVYKDFAQGIKRIHRTGQNKTTYYHIFYQDNFLDNEMKKSLDEKIDYSEKLFEKNLNNL